MRAMLRLRWGTSERCGARVYEGVMGVPYGDRAGFIEVWAHDSNKPVRKRSARGPSFPCVTLRLTWNIHMLIGIQAWEIWNPRPVFQTRIPYLGFEFQMPRFSPCSRTI